MSERKWTLTATEHMRLRDWIADPNRKPANLAFTAGPARQLAYAAESALSDVVVMSRAEFDAITEPVRVNDARDIDPRLSYMEVQVGRDEWNDAKRALAALDAARKGGG